MDSTRTTTVVTTAKPTVTSGRSHGFRPPCTTGRKYEAIYTPYAAAETVIVLWFCEKINISVGDIWVRRRKIVGVLLLLYAIHELRSNIHCHYCKPVLT